MHSKPTWDCLYPTRAGDIGKTIRRIIVEPLPEPAEAPVQEPSPEVAPALEPVPA